MKRRLGMTIVELLVITGLVMLIVSKLIDLGVSGHEIMDESSKLISLQNGIRSVLENMVQDVNSSLAIVGPMDHEMIIARFKGPVDDELIAMNTSDVNVAFPYYMDGQRTDVFWPVLFVHYKSSIKDQKTDSAGILDGTEGFIARIAKTGTLQAVDSPNGQPYFIDFYQKTGDETLISRKVIAKKATNMSFEYYGYDPVNGQLKGISSLGSASENNERISMVHVHLAAEDPYAQERRRTPAVEISTKIWSFRKIQENKYSEYFGHTDRDLTY